MPLISVIVPVYKVEPYLARCINSILIQTFTDFELILIDDGSPDNCGKICDDYVKKDNRIHVIHKENGGLSSARNAGIDWTFESSNSQWLTFIDSDDWIHPQYLKLLLSANTTNNTDISVCEYLETSEFDNFEIINNTNTQKTTPEDLFVNHHVTSVIAWGKLYRKNCFKSIRFPVGKLHEDEYTTYKILFEKRHISYLKEQLYFYYTNPDSIVRSNWTPRRLDAIVAFEEQITYFRKNGYTRALENVENNILWNIAAQIEITKNSKDYTSYAPNLKKKLRACIKDFKKDLNLSLKNNTNIYAVAYPKLTKFYWLVSYELSKLKFTRR